MTKKPKIYLDTSVYGGYFDVEFEKYTKLFFDKIFAEEFEVLFSDQLEDELKVAPQHVRDLATRVKSLSFQYIDTSAEAEALANEYITEKVVGETSKADCIHIALASIHHAKYLVSWNFKHIVNVQRIEGYKIINIKNGYHIPDIHTPMELMLWNEKKKISAM